MCKTFWLKWSQTIGKVNNLYCIVKHEHVCAAVHGKVFGLNYPLVWFKSSRSFKINNLRYMLKPESVAQWCRLFGVNYQLVSFRSGWSNINHVCIMWAHLVFINLELVQDLDNFYRVHLPVSLSPEYFVWFPRWMSNVFHVVFALKWWTKTCLKHERIALVSRSALNIIHSYLTFIFHLIILRGMLYF